MKKEQYPAQLLQHWVVLECRAEKPVVVAAQEMQEDIQYVKDTIASLMQQEAEAT